MLSVSSGEIGLNGMSVFCQRRARQSLLHGLFTQSAYGGDWKRGVSVAMDVVGVEIPGSDWSHWMNAGFEHFPLSVWEIA